MSATARNRRFDIIDQPAVVRREHSSPHPQPARREEDDHCRPFSSAARKTPAAILRASQSTATAGGSPISRIPRQWPSSRIRGAGGLSRPESLRSVQVGKTFLAKSTPCMDAVKRSSLTNSISTVTAAHDAPLTRPSSPHPNEETTSRKNHHRVSRLSRHRKCECISNRRTKTDMLILLRKKSLSTLDMNDSCI